ncbi:MAG: 1-acyl-sn-glycerol-3-phosphate acyltransferase [Spirochaetes bacterium]|nr:1-acyl-sn-glycerol-3-phosphate acyltransferase [Spirochaetota bacterium]
MLDFEKDTEKNGAQIPLNDFDGVIDGFINSFLEKITGILFRKIDFDSQSLQTLKEYSENKKIVYISFHSSNISLLILCHLLKKHKIEIPIVALEENPYLMQTVKHVWKRIVRYFKKIFFRKEYPHIFETDYIERKLDEGKSVLISLLSRKFFLRRYMEIQYDSLIYFVNLQKKLDEPVYLLPQMIFWNLNPERTRNLITPQATGDKGFIRGWLTVLRSASPAFVRILSPIDLRKEIENSKTDDTEQIAIRLRNKLLEMDHYEKRSVLGPVLRSKQEMMEKVLYHKDVLDMIEKQAKRENFNEKKLRKKAYNYFKEIAADYSVPVITFFKTILTFIINKIFDGIQYDPEDLNRIREASKKGPLILVPNHRSHMDYLMISYIFYMNRLSCPYIAAGKNLSFFPIGTLFRKSGAFFIRRSFRGMKLYPTVFKQYVRTLVSDGYSIEVFLEGGRTRTGKLVLPKLGFLYYLIEAIYSGYNDDLVFVPIAINYDRILEEKTYSKELRGSSKEAESVSMVISGRKLLKRKYGRVYVTFNDPFTLKEISEGTTDVKKLPDIVANTILRKISEVTVVTPFALATTAMLVSKATGISETVVKDDSVILYSYLKHNNARLSGTLADDPDMSEIIKQVISSYKDDNVLHEVRINNGEKEEVVEDLYSLKDDSRLGISFYKNSIIHYFIPASFTSAALLYLSFINSSRVIPEEDVKKEYNFIKDLFRREFLYSDDEDSGSGINENAYQYFSSDLSLIRNDDKIQIGDNAADNIKLFASIFKDHFESYYIVLNSVLNLKTDKIKKDALINTIRKNALKMYHLEEVGLAEALSLSNYSNAIMMLSDQGILKGGMRDSNNMEIKIENLEKAKDFSEKIRKYLSIL